MKRFPWVLLAAAAAGCGSPRSFVRGDETPPRRVDVRKEQDYARSFEDVRRVLASRFKISRSNPEEGILETEWSSDWPKPGQRKYFVRCVAAFGTDRRTLSLRAEAEYGKTGKAVPGRDLDLEALVASELQAALELHATPGVPPLPPPEQSRPEEPQRKRVDLRLTAGLPALQGAVQSDGSGSDSEIDFGDDGGLEQGTLLGFDLSIQAGKYVWISFGYSRATWSGDETTTDDELFDGVTFPAGTNVDGRLTVDRIDVGPKFVYDPGKSGFVEGQVRLSYLRENLKLDSAAASAEDRNDVFLLNPRFRGGVRFGDAYLVGELGTSLGYPAFTWGVEAGLGGGLRLGAVELELGYRGSYLDAYHGDPKDLRLGMRQPYLSLLIRF